MRKALIILGCLLLAGAGTCWLLWENKKAVTAHFISKHLGVPVKIQELDVTKQYIDFSHLWIGTPPDSRTSTSFLAERINADLDTPKILSNPLIIDQIYIGNIFVGLEYYQDGKTNWSYMLETDEEDADKGRDYLIRRLVLENLTVEVTQANGRKRRYPTISRMEFRNISSETGIPIREIEKAIFRLMMQDIMQKFNLLQEPLGLPKQLLPNLFK